MPRPELDEIVLGDDPHAWRSLGFTVVDDVVAIGGVRIRLAGSGGGTGLDGGTATGSAGARDGTDTGAGGFAGWSLRNLRDGADLDGLDAAVSHAPPPAPVEHPIGATAVDHLVALTPDFDRTVGALRAAGLDYRRTRDAGGGHRQAFFVIGPCLLELGGPATGEPAPRLWGMTLVVDDIDAAAERLGDLLGRVKDAVQPGRRIATVRSEAGLGVPVALMTPRV